ncbi:hypothetical protein UA08_02806 [Talaromyces atroroseus]|uniref:Uncharacterized protein n=1 Tax=Talaromyces atroroseus TaxID=1441469 RepID=A0A225B5W1_TALAT|nr:hypothetical protein UA08_02806 [Talaromyces atroroseus]OKL62265.1 hypothetical protein UA08_02806 [Talaromyces atroroseus]
MIANDSETTDQDVVKSLRELTASVQDVCNTITSEYRTSHPDKLRAKVKAKDEVTNTLYEQISKGRPEKIMDWEKIELMPIDKIEMENKQYAQKYEGFWKKIDESTSSEQEAAIQAYTSAFDRFQEIYRLLGWREDDKNALFDKSVLTQSRDLLIESIFGIEVYRMSRFGGSPERSRMLFEVSRLPRLLIILVRIACRQIYIVSACGQDKIEERPFSAPTTVSVLALVARALQYGNYASVTMDKLLRQCYARRILNQPDASDVDTYEKHFDLLYDCLTALDFTRKFREIREPLCLLFYMRHKSKTVHTIFELVETHREATIGINNFPELPLEENTSSVFSPEIFTVSYLLDFGGLNIEWTDCLDEHLKIYTGRNAIRIFAHPTFFYNNVDLHQNERDYMEPTYYELALTYALLFRPASSRTLKRLKYYVVAGENQQIPWHRCVTFNGRPIHRFIPRWDEGKVVDASKILDINPVQSPTKDILSESFYRCSYLPSAQIALNIADPSRAVKGIDNLLDRHRVTSTSMQQILELAPNYPEDLKFMITSVMENNFQDMESFVRFPYFASRLRRLKTYLDSRQPNTLRQLWVDRRDYRSWYHTPELERFVETILLDELCATASLFQNGVSCSLGNHTIGGFDIVYELKSSDGVVWPARIPLP